MSRFDDIVDKKYHGWSATKLLGAPVAALEGVSQADEAMLIKALKIRTIEDLATHWSVRKAQAVQAAADRAASDTVGLQARGEVAPSPAPRGKALADPGWDALYSLSNLRAWGIALPPETHGEPGNSLFVRETFDGTSGLTLKWSAVAGKAPAGGGPWIIACDVLQLDVDARLSGGTFIFARRIQVSPGKTVVLDWTEGPQPLYLYTQEIVDSAGTAVALTLQSVDSDASLTTYDLSFEGAFGAQGIVWQDASGLALNDALDPGFLNDGETLPVFLTTLFQVALLIESDHPELALRQSRWIGKLAASGPNTRSMALQALSSATRLTARLSVPEGTLVVPPLDPSVYASDLADWMTLLRDREQRWSAVQSDVNNLEQWLDSAQTALEDKQDDLTLASKLTTSAEKAREAALTAWAQSVNNLKFEEAKLAEASDDFEAGVEIWKRHEEIKAALKLTLDSIKFLVDLGKMIATLVVAPEAAAPDAAAAGGELASAAGSATSAIGGAAAEAASTASVAKMPALGGAANSAALSTTAGADGASSATVTAPKGTMDTLKAKGKTIADSAGGLGGDIQAIAGDVQRLIQIGKQSASLHKMSHEIGQAVDQASDATFSDLELHGVNVVTGGKQIWDALTLNVDTWFDNNAVYKDIDGGETFRTTFREVLIAAGVLCDCRLALASTSGRVVEAKLRMEAAASAAQRAQERAKHLAADVTWDIGIAQLVMNRVVDAKRAVYLLSEQYQRAWEYYTLQATNDLRPLPKLTGSVDEISTAVTNLTSLVWKLESLSPLPQMMADMPLDIPASAFTALPAVGSSGTRWAASWIIPPNVAPFDGLARVRFDRVRAFVSFGDGAVPPVRVEVHLGTSGRFLDVMPDGSERRFLGSPVDLQFRYTQAGASDRSIQIDGGLPANLKGLFFNPTPFTLWTAIVELTPPTGQTLDLKDATSLRLHFHGEATSTNA